MTQKDQEIEARLSKIETILYDIRKDQRKTTRILFEGNGDSLVTRVRLLELRQDGDEENSSRARKVKDALTISFVATIVSAVCSFIFTFFGG